jgi:hypothetical protein
VTLFSLKTLSTVGSGFSLALSLSKIVCREIQLVAYPSLSLTSSHPDPRRNTELSVGCERIQNGLLMRRALENHRDKRVFWEYSIIDDSIASSKMVFILLVYETWFL